jgi:hypothetical protein
MEFNSDFRYDLEFGVVEGETWFHNVISNSKIEVKTDRLTQKTGNVYIEYESRGKPSGIRTSEADFWVYKINQHQAIIIEKNELKRKLKHLVDIGKAKMGVKGGDNNTSLGILVKVKELI